MCTKQYLLIVLITKITKHVVCTSGMVSIQVPTVHLNEILFAILFCIAENNLMGAAEWTGYSGTTPSYSPFSSLQSTPSSYGYENSSIPEHHSNFHIPTGKYFPKLFKDLVDSLCLLWS